MYKSYRGKTEFSKQIAPYDCLFHTKKSTIMFLSNTKFSSFFFQQCLHQKMSNAFDDFYQGMIQSCQWNMLL